MAVYVDPGLGSLLWQLVVSAIVGAGFTFRKYVAALARRLRGTRAPKPPT